MFYKFFDKNAWDTNSQTRNGISENQELAKELRKPINRKLKKIYIYSSFRVKVRGANFSNMQL